MSTPLTVHLAVRFQGQKIHTLHKTTCETTLGDFLDACNFKEVEEYIRDIYKSRGIEWYCRIRHVELDGSRILLDPDKTFADLCDFDRFPPDKYKTILFIEYDQPDTI